MKHKNWGLFACVMLLLFLSGCDFDKSLFKSDPANCWPCKMYLQAFQAISAALIKALPVMCDNCLTLLELAVPMWLTFKILPWIYSFNPPNFEKDIKEILIVVFKTFVVALLLAVKTTTINVNHLFPAAKPVNLEIEVVLDNQNRAIYNVAGKLVLQPIGDIFLNMSQLALATPSQVGIPISNYNSTGLTSSLFDSIWGAIDKATGGALDQGMNIVNQFKDLYQASDRITSEDPMFGALPIQIQSIIWTLYQALWSGMGLAFQLFTLNSFMGWITGVILFCGLFYMVLILPISFVESILTMGLTVILLPLYLSFWIFPGLSKGILKKVFHNLFSAFFDILFNCIYVAFLVSVIRLYLQTDQKLSYLFSSDFQTQEAGLRLQATNLNTTFLIMTVLIWTILQLFKHVGEFSSYFFDGAGKKSGIIQFMDRLKNMGKHLAIAGAKTVGAAAMAVVGQPAIAGGMMKSAGSSLKKSGEEAKGMMGDGTKEMMGK